MLFGGNGWQENRFLINYGTVHVITGEEGQPQLMYVDQHYIHEVTSPQAFQGLRDAGRRLRRPDLTFGTFDHNVPTVNIYDIRDVISKAQIDKLLAENVEEFGIEHAAHGSEKARNRSHGWSRNRKNTTRKIHRLWR